MGGGSREFAAKVTLGTLNLIILDLVFTALLVAWGGVQH